MDILSCSDLQVIEPVAETSKDGCPVTLKLTHISTNEGVQAVVSWTLKRADGTAVNIADCEAADSCSVTDSVTPGCVAGSIKVRFTSCDETGLILEVDGAIYSGADGIVRFELPAAIANNAGIYRTEIGVFSSEDRLLFVDKGLVNVERGLFGSTDAITGPPTLAEIRTALRDSPADNVLLGAVEFTTDEIIFSTIRPVQEWNEIPPDIVRYNCGNFPYREYWLKGIVGHLLQTAAHYYTRNKLGLNHGGITGDPLAKDSEYQQMANQYRAEYREWLLTKKVELNARRAYMSFGSEYS